jgi:glycosyltransferase involved in cell wall biosynthesis
MTRRILFVASLHHPEQLRATRSDLREQPPLFPPSMHQHFWEKALRRHGDVLDVFYRSLPVWSSAIPRGSTQRHAQGMTPRKIFQAAWNRVPPRFNPDYRLRNRALVERARAFQPDILWVVGGNSVIYAETLAVVKRETGCRIVYESGDSPIVFARPIERAAAPLYDLALVNDYYHGIQWLELGAQAMIALPSAACDPDFHRPYRLLPEERARLACDVAFVGTLVPDHLYSRRVAALRALSDAGVDVGIWSVHDVPDALKKHARGGALGAEMQRILSAGSLCFNAHGNFMRYGGNQRLFEAAASGVFQIADDLPGVRAWFPEVDGTPTVITYADHADLVEKVRYYLAHDGERQRIADSAQRHVYAHHTYDQRVAALDAVL